MNTTLAIFMPWLSTFAVVFTATLVTAAFGKGLSVLKAHGINTTVYEAIGRAGGVAYSSFVASGQPVTNKAALLAAADAGGAYLATMVPDALAAKGVTDPVAMANLAAGELGKLLALKPPAADVATGLAAPGSAMQTPDQAATADANTKALAAAVVDELTKVI